MAFRILLIAALFFSSYADDNSTLDPLDEYYYYPSYYYSNYYVDFEDASGEVNETIPSDGVAELDGSIETCFLCQNSTQVPNPDFVLRDETCGEWNGAEFYAEPTIDVCEVIQTTYGSACGCSLPPTPKCNVCHEGDYIWLKNSTYFSYVDDVCVKIINEMSIDENLCEEAKHEVSRLCCVNNFGSPSPSPSQSIHRSPKSSKSVHYVTESSGNTKASKGKKNGKSDMFKFTTEASPKDNDGFPMWKESKSKTPHKAIKSNKMHNFEDSSKTVKVKTGKVSQPIDNEYNTFGKKIKNTK